MDIFLTSFYMSVGWEPMAWFYLFVAVTVLDAALTVYAVGKGGIEANPVISWIAKRVGIIPALFVTKALGITAVYASLTIVLIYLPILIAVYAGVCAWNVRVILRS